MGDKDEANHCDSKELSALHQEVQPLREEALKHVGTLLALLRLQRGRHRHCGAVPTPLEDRALQRAQCAEEPDLWQPPEGLHALLRRQKIGSTRQVAVMSDDVCRVKN